MLPLIDTHAHLEEITDLSETITQAKDAGIAAIIAVGSDAASNGKIRQISRDYPGFVYPAFGLHPSQLAETDVRRTLEFIATHITEAVAVGEVGLDYHKRVRATADKSRQQDIFREITKIAKTHNKTVSLHSRYAWQDTFNIVAEAQLEKVVFHWYTGTSRVLRDIISRGYYLSATPALEYHEEHRRAIKEAPLERLLLETDTPVVYGRGRDFEYESRPVDVRRSLRVAAALKGVSEAELAAITTKNARDLFCLPE